MSEELYIGLDVGSVSLNTALLNGSGKIVKDNYTRMKGQPLQTTARVLGEILKSVSRDRVRAVAVTGSGGKLIAQLLGSYFVNEIIAQAKAVEHLYPEVKTVIDIGGEDSKLILLKYEPSSEATLIEDFAMNTICAAGTGSFLDQQAIRLGLSIEEFGNLALKSEKPPRIAGRCSVFAKTDMIHLQQEAAPDYDIVAGLCYALARNFKSNIGKAKLFTRPIAFHGGVAKNRGMVKAFEDVLELGRGGLVISQYHASMGAIGAALIGRQKATERLHNFRGVEELEEYIRTYKEEKEGLLPLSGFRVRGCGLKTNPYASCPLPHNPIRGYLGIDVGSISTNVVVLDENRNLIARRYLPTAGRPIEAVRRGIREIGEEIDTEVEIVGVGTTGSGRHMIGDFVGADIVKNEITAQARAAVEIDPAVDTIFEIGGQDSKFISLEDGVVVDFEMNKVCAAGTGSFLEEQAEKLDIKIEEEFGKLALQSKCPLGLGERCTVFMESNIHHHQQLGAERQDLVAGLSYSIVQNYLNRVVGDKRIGDNIFFQGAVAFNQGVVAAFERVLEKPITVPQNNDVTGAIGVALIAMEQSRGKSDFKGFQSITEARYQINSFECHDCPNNCEVRRLTRQGDVPLYYGSRCGKYDVAKKKERAEGIPDLFREREELLLGPFPESLVHRTGAKRVGIPRALIFHELFPLWKAFFIELGFEVVISDKTNKRIIHQGLEVVASETCFPIKVAHGHVLNLLEKGIDYLFLPVIINMRQPNPKIRQSVNCPYIQTISHMVQAAIDLDSKGVELLQPTVALGWERWLARKMLRQIGKQLKCSPKRINSAVAAAERAQETFYEALQSRGREVLASLKETDRAIVIVARPYNACDPGINLALPKKLRDLGALAIPMDYLPLDSVDLSGDWSDMYWRYGQKIISAAEIIRQDPRLNAAYITNFGCGPDSFIIRFFRDEMGKKPFLIIEVDEHSADVGAITRCEAFLDSLKNQRKRKPADSGQKKRRRVYGSLKGQNRTIYIPNMGDHAFVLRAAFKACGVAAEVFPPSDEQTLEWGRKFTLGKECYPCIITTGDMVKIVKSPGFDPGRSAFFMPTTEGPCRFGQYNRLQRMVLDELGYHDVPIVSPNQGKDFYKNLGIYGGDFVRRAWQGIVAVDILEKMLRETRPYEEEPGAADKVYKGCLDKVCLAILKARDLLEVMKASREAFKGLKINYRQRPIIGVIGEVFVRSHEFSNNYIVREVESLGGEVWVPPFGEWIFHVNSVLKSQALLRSKYVNYLKTFIMDQVQRYDEHRLFKPIKDLLRVDREATVKEVWANASPYLPCWFGEAALSLGKSVDYARRGACGIINVMPFTCLPGTITTAVLKRFREHYNNLPCLTMAYDGLGETNARTRLEAFMYQAHQYKVT